MKVTIKPSEAVTVIGMKGSGKTTLMLKLIELTKPRGEHRVAILDTKQVGDFDKYPSTDRLDQVHKLAEKYPIFVYAPCKEEKHDPSYIDGFLEWCYERWNTTVVIDELTQIVWGNDVTDSYKDLADRGRARHTSIWQGNQKPVFVPHAALSESDHYFIFNLMVGSDRDKVATILGNKVKQRPPDKHGFWYFHRDMREPIYIPGIRV